LRISRTLALSAARILRVVDEYPSSSGRPSRPRRAADPGDERQLAVPLQHEPRSTAAPRVIAKGRGALAEQILQIAFDRDVKVRSDADLAEILAAVELDCEIPLEAFAAVAEILSYVYRAQNRACAEPLP
jgi:flagellar biosynthesis protein